MSTEGLRAGARVAVIGAGVAGLSSAVALKQAARMRGKGLEVHLFGAPPEPERLRPPVFLSPECRSRLAALGCRVPERWRRRVLTHLEVHSGGQSSALALPSGGVWVVDEWPEGQAGQSMLTTALREVAAQAGVRGRPLRATSLQRDADEDDPTWTVGAAGRFEPFDGVVVAPGIAQGSPERLLSEARLAPTLPAVAARLGELRGGWPGTARLWLSPLPGVDALLLVPCTGSAYALAFGPRCGPADLCEALMRAARDGLLPEGFELSALEPTRLAAGAGSRLGGPGRCVVGAAALGHVFSIGLRDALLMAHRAAVSLEGPLPQGPSGNLRYEREDLNDLLEDAREGARTLTWLRRAGPDAHRAFARARPPLPFEYGGPALWGTGTPTARALLVAARNTALRGLGGRVGRWLRSAWGGPRHERRRVEPRLVFLVDDDAELRGALATALEDRGAEVVTFADELSLLCAAARRPPDAILLDVVLRRVDGLRLCQSLKSHPLTSSSRVLVMSGLDRPHVRERARAAGADAFLPKPVDMERLWRRILGHAAGPGAQSPSSAWGTDADAQPQAW